MNKERLLKLANHLRHGKLGHKVFNFAHLNKCDVGEKYKKNGCGTLGCALGEMPIVDKNLWYFNECHDPVVIDYEYSAKSAEWYFSLSESQSDHLFLPGCQNTKLYGGVELLGDATKEQVAANIEAFVAKMESKR